MGIPPTSPPREVERYPKRSKYIDIPADVRMDLQRALFESFEENQENTPHNRFDEREELQFRLEQEMKEQFASDKEFY